MLKNALDFLYAEWNNKTVGFVSYDVAGGARAARHLRAVCGALQMVDVTQQVTLPLQTEFENFTLSKPGDHNIPGAGHAARPGHAWTVALAPLRSGLEAGRGSPIRRASS